MDALRVLLPDTDATLELGRALGELLREDGPGAVMLRGDLGSGKTTLMRGLVPALEGGEDAEVASPSFTIVNVYATVPPVLHADLFRCPPGFGVPEELEEALDDSVFEGKTRGPLVCVEWPEHLPTGIMPAKRLDILLEPCQGSRRFSVVAYGDAAERVLAALEERVRRTRPDWL